MSYKLEKPYTDIQRADFVCEHQGLNYYEDDNCIIMYLNSEKIVNGEVVDISQTPEYIDKQLAKAKTDKLTQVINKYDQIIKNGIFSIDSTYFGNMSWYDTWTKAVSLYESGLVLSDTFTVRLYKKINNIYYNYNTTQTLSSFKNMLKILNSQQFLTYQPIRNNLVSQIKLATTIDEVNTISNLIDTAFGDIIDETSTLIEDGE